MSAILKHDPPLLSAADAAISPPLASVIQHCLEKERDQRFQSARDLAFALSRLAGTSTSDAVTPCRARPRALDDGGSSDLRPRRCVIAVGGAAYLARPQPMALRRAFSS